ASSSARSALAAASSLAARPRRSGPLTSQIVAASAMRISRNATTSTIAADRGSGPAQLAREARRETGAHPPAGGLGDRPEDDDAAAEDDDRAHPDPGDKRRDDEAELGGRRRLEVAVHKALQRAAQEHRLHRGR